MDMFLFNVHKTATEGLTICIQLFETVILQRPILIEFLSLCTNPSSSHFFIHKLTSTKMQESSELLNIYWALENRLSFSDQARVQFDLDKGTLQKTFVFLPTAWKAW